MLKPPILVVDDDRKTVDLIRLYLERNGYPVLTACCDEHQAIDIAHARKTGSIILNLMLPQVDGLQVCRVLSDHADVPIILLTAKSTEENKLEGLDEGTDDYVTNTFSPRELTARVRAILRRGRPQATGNQQLSVSETWKQSLILPVDQPAAIHPRQPARI